MDLHSPFDNAVSEKCVLAAVLSGTLAKLIGMSIVSKKHRQNTGRFELVGKVSDLVSFPMKSCGGVHTTDAVCTDVGLETDGLIDRHWMLIGEDEKHFNMRLEPRLAMVHSHSMGDVLRLTAPGMEPLDLPKRPDLKTAKIIDKVAYGQPIRVVDCGEHANEWFRRYIGGDRKVQLVSCREELCTRDVTTRPRDWENNARKGDKTVFSFLTSYMLTTTASLRDLNQRLTKPTSMDNFRPNIVVDNDIPYDEDNWEEIRIGDNLSFHRVEPCLRCIITTVGPDGVKSKDMQPLKMLRSFRCRPPYGYLPLFGSYISNDTTGNIRVGDPVYAKRKPLTA